MTPKSSAGSIPYDIRPSKQLERRIILDMLMTGGANGLPVSESHYVGMGGIKFFDFVMFYRYLGLRKFVSLEHDSKILPRCEFNKPFDLIKLYEGGFSDFISEFREKKPQIFWIDYDYGLNSDLEDDVVSIGAKLPPKSFLFLTVDAEPPKGLVRESSAKRKAALYEELGHFVGDRELRDFEDDHFRFTVADTLLRIVRYAFNARSDGEFYPTLKAVYKDSAWMVTVGGVFARKDDASGFLKEWRARMPFLPAWQNDQFLELPRFNITDAERRLLDILMTKKRRKAKLPAPLKKLGLNRAFATDYQKFLRFIPRYFEAFN